MFWSKKSYKVKLRGRSGIEYTEGKRRIIIGSEFMADEDPGIVIYADSLKNWESPYQHEKLSEDDIERIKSNVLNDLAKHKIKVEWD